MKPCPGCDRDNHDQAVECRYCLRPFPVSTHGQALTPPVQMASAAPVRIVDIDMPFGSMVTFMVKWAIATIPAFILLFLIGAMLIALFGGLGLLAGLAAT